MSDEQQQQDPRRERMESAIRARSGMSPAARERLREENEAANDWRGNCPRCGAEVRGTLAQLRAHVCQGVA